MMIKKPYQVPDKIGIGRVFYVIENFVRIIKENHKISGINVIFPGL